MTKIRSIRILSAAKVNAVLHGILGLLLAPLILLGPGLLMAGEKRGDFSGAVIAAAMMPFLSALFGFIIGAVLAFIYNAISHAIGGIEVELNLPSLAMVPPPPIAPAQLASQSTPETALLPPTELGIADISRSKCE